MKYSVPAFFSFALVATSLFSASAFGQQPSSLGGPAQEMPAQSALPTTPQVATAATANKNDPEAVTCKKEQVVGSRFPKTVCTRASDRANSQELARQMQGNYGNAGGN